MTSFAHAVNPVRVPQTSDLFVAQPITFEGNGVKRHIDRMGEGLCDPHGFESDRLGDIEIGSLRHAHGVDGVGE